MEFRNKIFANRENVFLQVRSFLFSESLKTKISKTIRSYFAENVRLISMRNYVNFYLVFVIAANRLLSTMNKSIDPCDNFYGYACGNFGNYVQKVTERDRNPSSWIVASQILLERKIAGTVPDNLMNFNCINCIELQ